MQRRGEVKQGFIGDEKPPPALNLEQKVYEMLKSTRDAIAAVCRSDPSITAAQVKAALAELDGEGIREVIGEPPPRAFTREQVGALLGVSRKTVTGYARRGLLVPIYSGAGGKRAQAYTGESVNALLTGQTNRKEA